MDKALLKALKLFLWLSILFFAGYWLYALYDDYELIARYGFDIKFVLIWLLYFLPFFSCFAVIYWLAVTAVLLLYYKIIRRSDRRQ